MAVAPYVAGAPPATGVVVYVGWNVALPTSD